MADLSTADINDLPDDAFAFIEPGGTKDASGKTTPRDLRHFPIHDKAHADNAAARIAQGAEFGDKAIGKVKAAQKKFGEQPDDSGSRALVTEFDGFISRAFPLEDIAIRAGDGRTVEAYAAVFDVEVPIQDGQGQYLEVIDRTAFNRAVDKARPQGSRGYWMTRCFYNHGMTLHGTPSERGSVPIGVTREIRVESRGLLTVTRYNETPFADEILESIKSGSITGQSFTGRIVRSDPSLARGLRYRPSQTVRRLELGLSEYGPTPNPFYTDAEIVSVRAALSNATYGTAPADDDGPSPDDGDLAGTTSQPADEPLAGHESLVTRMRALAATHRGIDWRKA
jgi:HK97 family phage prohead protease